MPVLILEAAFPSLFSIEIKQIVHQHLNSLVLWSFCVCVLFLPVCCLHCSFGGCHSVCLSYSCHYILSVAIAVPHVCLRLVEYYSQFLIPSRLSCPPNILLLRKQMSLQLCSPALTFISKGAIPRTRKVTQRQDVPLEMSPHVHFRAGGESVRLVTSVQFVMQKWLRCVIETYVHS